MLEQATAYLNKPVWRGGRTLHIGELIVFAAALGILYWQRGKFSFKNVYVWIALIMILLAMIIW